MRSYENPMSDEDLIKNAFYEYEKKEFFWDESIMSQIPAIDHFAAGWSARGDLEKSPVQCKKTPIYSWATFMERAKILKGHGLTVSNQYGMIFLLNEDGDILLRLDALVSEEDRMSHC